MKGFPISSSLKGARARIHQELISWLDRIWYSSPSQPSMKFLFPLLGLGSRIYGQALRHNQQRARVHRKRIPAVVISVGNLVVGGTGKTPLVLWLAGYLRSRGRKPAVLTRGYGRKSRNVSRVPSVGETFSQVPRFGDEPVLLAHKERGLPVWVGRDRWVSGQAALRSSNVDTFLLDDGFQHIRLQRDLDLVLLDAQNPFGNGSLLPLGPLREPVMHLDRASAIILTRSSETEAMERTRSNLRIRFQGKPVFCCRHELAGMKVGLDGPKIARERIMNEPAVAFAGIARPDLFFQSLLRMGLRLSAYFSFPDHHVYGAGDIGRLFQAVRRTEARFLVTTEKDAVRLPPQIQSLVLVPELELAFGSDHDSLCRYLDEQLRLV